MTFFSHCGIKATGPRSQFYSDGYFPGQALKLDAMGNETYAASFSDLAFDAKSRSKGFTSFSKCLPPCLSVPRPNDPSAKPGWRFTGRM
ncbi:hypothetical protein ABKN59_001321 [Abortiporus biennis]